MSEWQPIETAVLDISDRMLWCPDRAEIHIGYYAPLADSWVSYDYGNGSEQIYLYPSHWMPLPEPPKP